MALRIGDTAPDFTADTTEGRIAFHNWLGDSWGVLFSHPKDFTPVCTTELGCMARLKPEFDRRNVKVIGLSVDSVEDHARWANDIRETQGTAPNYPVIGDSDLSVSMLYDMLPADTQGTAAGRTHRVLMQVGDQLGDLVTIVANTPQGREDAARPYLGWVGERWFVLPNPTYGSWEPALFDNNWRQPEADRRAAKRATLRLGNPPLSNDQ